MATLLTFSKLKILIDILLTLGFSLPLTFTICKTPLGETVCLGNPYFAVRVTHQVTRQFFEFHLSQSIRPPMVA